MSVQTIQHAPNLTVFHDVAAQPEPLEYHWFFHGVHYFTEARKDEASAELWLRTLTAINDARLTLARDRSTVLDAQAPVTCYAGELEPASLAKLESKHLRAHIVEWCLRIGNSKCVSAGDGVAAVKALALVSELTGIATAKRTSGNKRTRAAATAQDTDTLPLPPSILTR
jgi:hypothetical protein